GQTLGDPCEASLLPRRVTRRLRLTNLFYSGAWIPWSWVAERIKSGKRRETFLGVFGPLSLLVLLALWAVGLIFGFTLLLWGSDAPVDHDGGPTSFATYLYLSGVTFLTLRY